MDSNSLLKNAGFSDEEISQYNERQMLSQAGFSQEEIDRYFKTPELSFGRVGGAIREGAKDVVRDTSYGIGRVLQKDAERGRIQSDRMADMGRRLGFGRRSQIDDIPAQPTPDVEVLRPNQPYATQTKAAQALIDLSNTEALKQDPEYQKSSGYVEDVARMSPQVASQIIASLVGGPAAGIMTMGTQIAGGTAKRLEEEGVERDRAMQWGGINALLQAPLEQIGISKALRFFDVRKAALKKMRDIVGVAGTEFVTEFAQAYPESFTSIFAKNPDKETLENAKQFLDDFWETSKQGAYEGLVAAPLSLIGAGAGSLRKRPDEEQQLKAEQEIEQQRRSEAAPSETKESLKEASRKQQEDIARWNDARNQKIFEDLVAEEIRDRKFGEIPEPVRAPLSTPPAVIDTIRQPQIITVTDEDVKVLQPTPGEIEWDGTPQPAQLPPGQGFQMTGEFDRYSPEFAQQTRDLQTLALPEGQGFETGDIVPEKPLESRRT